MKIAIHQPQYLPWLNYFKKIEECDLFIVLDSVQFQKNGLHNRNKIKSPTGEIWLTVPIKKKTKQSIIEVEINNKINWNKKHWESIKQYYGKSKNFKSYENELKKIYSLEWTNLNELNLQLIKTLMQWMKISTPIKKNSELKIKGERSQLILNICKFFNAKNYISGIGGKNYLDEGAFKKSGIKIEYLSFKPYKQYKQNFMKNGFINNLSSLDVIMNCEIDWRKLIE